MRTSFACRRIDKRLLKKYQEDFKIYHACATRMIVTLRVTMVTRRVTMVPLGGQS